MTEILQAEIVAYSSPKEIFVNASLALPQLHVSLADANLLTLRANAESPAGQWFQATGLWKS
jgi:hypothetical protein